MLQELLLALYGFPGAIFVESVDQNGEDLESVLTPASEYFPSISNGELALCADLLKLGSCYNVLEKFIRRYAGPSNSLYMAAIGFGFDDALKAYRNVLCALESEYLADATLDVSHASYRLHKYKMLLPILADLAKKIDRIYKEACSKCDPLGCRLLDVLLSSAPPGLPGPRSVVRKLMARGMLVFHRQITSWLLYGVLHDPHNEFFVERANDASHSPDQLNLSRFDESVHLPTDNNGFSDFDQQPKDAVFSLSVNRIPSFLPTAFAQQVLFVGEAVYHTSRRSIGIRNHEALLTNLEATFSDRFKQLSEALHSTLGVDNTAVETSSVQGLIDVSPLQQAVSDVRSFVSRHVWHDLVEKHNLSAYLRSVKDVALLGRGELFLAFLDQLSTVNPSSNSVRTDTSMFLTSWPSVEGLLDRQAPSKSMDGNELHAVEYDVACAFLAAARAVSLDDDELDSRFRFYLSLQSDVSDNADHISTNPVLWDCLHLEILVPPVFDLVFSKHVCRGYDRLFRYLAAIRRAQVSLQQFWADQTALWRHNCARKQFGPRASAAVAAGEISPAQSIIDCRLLIRNHMAFIVENLQYYLQVDVIDSQFCHLMDRIQSDQEADLVQVVHEAFVASLQAQSLLFHPTARSCIVNLLSVCQQFVHVASHSPDSVSERENRLISDFQQLSAALFHCLVSSRLTGARPGVGLDVAAPMGRRIDQLAGRPTADLGQLLLRLDFNQFYSRSHGTMDVIT
ncbi:Gamma-tubulin complex component [Fasciola gigantica]|uniref:Gamma-tubulin complex component n=1 Tax=Fasciola gigantica TaxID=46835 RepID=A0A504YLJ6_FASGI|nr:Gamma-tubulin complex component [Fasciola gigantica]